jgi:hypothetical protein
VTEATLVPPKAAAAIAASSPIAASFPQFREGALRLVVGTVTSACDNTPRQGLLVQELVAQDDFGYDLKWKVACPLTDAGFMLDLCPGRWRTASAYLRDLLERGQPVTLEVEREALAKASGRPEMRHG